MAQTRDDALKVLDGIRARCSQLEPLGIVEDLREAGYNLSPWNVLGIRIRA